MPIEARTIYATWAFKQVDKAWRKRFFVLKEDKVLSVFPDFQVLTPTLLASVDLGAQGVRILDSKEVEESRRKEFPRGRPMWTREQVPESLLGVEMPGKTLILRCDSPELADYFVGVLRDVIASPSLEHYVPPSPPHPPKLHHAASDSTDASKDDSAGYFGFHHSDSTEARPVPSAPPSEDVGFEPPNYTATTTTAEKTTDATTTPTSQPQPPPSASASADTSSSFTSSSTTFTPNPYPATKGGFKQHAFEFADGWTEAFTGKKEVLRDLRQTNWWEVRGLVHDAYEAYRIKDEVQMRMMFLFALLVDFFRTCVTVLYHLYVQKREVVLAVVRVAKIGTIFSPGGFILVILKDLFQIVFRGGKVKREFNQMLDDMNHNHFSDAGKRFGRLCKRFTV